MTTTFDETALRSKITKLLAKAEGTTNAAERDAFMEKAEQMMLRLGIERAELESTGQAGREEIVEVRQTWRGNYSIVMVPFVADVAQGFGGLTILQSTYSPVLRHTFVIGPKSQVEDFLTLVNSLHVQVMAALKAYQRETVELRRYMTDMEKYVNHRSFISGFGREVRRRLTKLRLREEVEVSAGAQLVLASREADTAQWISDRYGKTRPSRGGVQQSDYFAAAAGHVAGQSANLGQPGVDGSKKVLPNH
jgi:hypothetical protein